MNKNKFSTNCYKIEPNSQRPKLNSPNLKYLITLYNDDLSFKKYYISKTWIRHREIWKMRLRILINLLRKMLHFISQRTMFWIWLKSKISLLISTTYLFSLYTLYWLIYLYHFSNRILEITSELNAYRDC